MSLERYISKVSSCGSCKRVWTGGRMGNVDLVKGLGRIRLIKYGA